MRKRKRVVEIDVDGVLANMDGCYEPHVKQYIPDFTEEKYVRQWDMANIGEKSPEALETIKSLWYNPKFIAGLPRFPKVLEGMKILSEIPNLQIVVHTHIKGNQDVVNARYNWVEQLKDEAGANITIDISVGPTKQMREGSYYLIEDCLRNLNTSSAKVKFLVRRCHNRVFTEDDIVGGEVAMVVEDFYTACLDIYEDMMGKPYEVKA